MMGTRISRDTTVKRNIVVVYSYQSSEQWDSVVSAIS